jgi:hypothetical protein
MFLLHVLVRLGHRQRKHVKYEVENYFKFHIKIIEEQG